MSVDGSNIVEPELLEERRARPRNHPSSVLVDLGRRLLQRLWELLRHALGDLAELAQRPVGLQARQGGAQPADRVLVLAVVLRRQRHLLVVVEDHNHVRVEESRVVHRLVGHPARDGPVADHGDAVVLASLEVAADRHAQRRRDRRRGVAGAEGVVLGLGAVGEAGEAAALPDGRHLGAAA